MGFLPAVASGVSAVGGLLNASKGPGSSPQTSPMVNQNQVYLGNTQTQEGIGNQRAFLGQALQHTGFDKQEDVYKQQQALANQFQGLSQGVGPNPAMAQLNQATGQNVANQAALMAGQRGGSANAGLIARQAGMQGGNLQQQAVGQGATMQAQQQIAAMQALQQQQGMLGGMANQQQSQAQNALNSYQNAAQNQYSAMMGIGGQQNQQQINQAQNQNQFQQHQQDQFGKILGGFGNAAGGASALFGGGSNPTTQGGSSQLGNNYSMQAFGGAIEKEKYAMGGPVNQIIPHVLMASGGYVNAMVSPGERYLPPSEVQKVENGEKPAVKAGEKIQGKAKVKGDSLKNDVVPKKLKEGGIVLPKSVMEHPNAGEEAKRFVMAILAKQGLKR